MSAAPRADLFEPAAQLVTISIWFAPA